MFGILIVAAAALAASAPSAITTKDPDAFVQQLSEMGYHPESVEKKGGTVSMVAHLATSSLAVVLGGCKASRDCTYVALVGSFSDAKNPPADWLARVNADYDLIKIWKGDDNKVFYAASAVVDELPRESFKRWIELVDQSSDAVGEEAVKAGLTK